MKGTPNQAKLFHYFCLTNHIRMQILSSKTDTLAVADIWIRIHTLVSATTVAVLQTFPTNHIWVHHTIHEKKKIQRLEVFMVSMKTVWKPFTPNKIRLNFRRKIKLSLSFHEFYLKTKRFIFLSQSKESGFRKNRQVLFGFCKPWSHPLI